jgi:phage recombination protein Bet
MSAQTATAPERTAAGHGLVTRFAMRYHVEPAGLMRTLKATAFYNADGEVTNEQMMALLVVADQYGLNPFTKEIYAFPDKKRGGIVPIVSIDGWSRIVNEHPQFNGMEFEYGPPAPARKGAPEWIDCVMFRKDRGHPTRIREWLNECYRSTQPWDSHPARMLRHKAFIQCARVAFALVGIYDEDEAQRIFEGESRRVTTSDAAIDSINERVTKAQTFEGSHVPPRPLPPTPPDKMPQPPGPPASDTPDDPPETHVPPRPLPPRADPPLPSPAMWHDRLIKATTSDQLDVLTDLIVNYGIADQDAMLIAAKTKRAEWNAEGAKS